MSVLVEHVIMAFTGSPSEYLNYKVYGVISNTCVFPVSTHLVPDSAIMLINRFASGGNSVKILVCEVAEVQVGIITIQI